MNSGRSCRLALAVAGPIHPISDDYRRAWDYPAYLTLVAGLRRADAAAQLLRGAVNG